MPEVLMIQDKPQTIFDVKDFEYHVEQCMGYEASKYFREVVEELQADVEEAKQGVGSDLTSYEASLESNARAFQDIQDEVFSILKYCHGIINYPIKYKAVEPVVKGLQRIKTIIKNQI